MTLLETIQYTTLVALVLNALGVASLIVLKAVNRARRRRAEARKHQYMRLISRHVTYEHCTDPIPPEAATDPVFIDALIDVRNALAGSDLASLERLMSRHGVVQKLTHDLEASFPRVRRLRAAMALAELGGEDTVPVLLDHLSDREPEIRVQAARGLGRVKWTPAIDEIVARFSIETPWVRARFADTLVGFGAAATWPLVAYVTVNHRHETAGPVAAIRTLAAIGDDQAVKPLMEVLHSARDPEIAIAVIEALGSSGNPLAAPALRDSMRVADWRIRAKAATALGQVADTQALDVLAVALTDHNWWVRRNSAAALAAIPGGMDRLFDALAGSDPYAADAAAEALADVGELSAARSRVETGAAMPRDHELVAHAEVER